MGDFEFYPDINRKLNLVFNSHEIIGKIIPEEFDKYLEIVKFTTNFLKKKPKEVISNIEDINSIYKKIEHIQKCSSKSEKFMKDELIFLNQFRDFFEFDKQEVKLNMHLYPDLLSMVKMALRLRNRRMRKMLLWSFWKKPPYLEMNSLNNVYLFIFENNERLLTKLDMQLENKGVKNCSPREILQLLGILENIVFSINYMLYKSMEEDRVIFSNKGEITVKQFYNKVKKIENVELSRLYKRTLSLWQFWPKKFQKVDIKFNLEEGAYI